MQNINIYAEIEDVKDCMKIDNTINDIELMTQKSRFGQIVIARIEKALVGYMRLEYIWEKYTYISWLFVKEPYRRTGIARQLLDYILQSRKSVLSSTQSNHPLGIAWHKNVGFEELGIWNSINEDGSDELFFKKFSSPESRILNPES